MRVAAESRDRFPLPMETPAICDIASEIGSKESPTERQTEGISLFTKPGVRR